VKQLLVTTKDAWQSLGIGRTRFFEILGAGQIRAVRLGGRTLVPVAELERFAAELPQRSVSRAQSSARESGRTRGADAAAHSSAEPQS
jgi:hypothetical protein